MSEKRFVEGDKCNKKDCNGIFKYNDVEDCSCHINSPCSQCIDNPLVCNKCLYEPDELTT